ncbi:polyprenyl synthetase family protein [Jiella sp. MQZ9-1]|uniref:Octaprenyl diphosphate synthase n=1 Tax=Jiella flava TaxID=2816857 RepID=A0A939JXJ1_9HYPH|nr:polyprenyl synthetase family protein [Jiella flava]MBO0664132.1 polyprenyl synthetase family protein [Jiella flava]MCD2472704.1 polyprenyl synthetase family protein [Jiella flava]
MVSLASQAARRQPQESIDPILSLSARDMARVNELILAMAGSNVELIPEIARHLISSGGKRLRPMLTIASALAHGYDGDHHVKLAASVEFMHTATLLHDDVVDESDMRRGKRTARTIWGNQASVLVGDFLLGQAFKMMVEVGSLDALAILSAASAVIAEGEVWQLAAAKTMTTTEADYIAVIDAKTAALFSAATEVGPVIAGKGEAERQAMRGYGRSLGLAFQLVDDVLDYGGSAAALGKNTGDDFREGKITLPVIVSYERGDAEEKAFWQRAMEDGENDDAALAHAKELMQRHDALEETIARARSFGEDAYRAAASLPISPAREAMLGVVDFCIERLN